MITDVNETVIFGLILVWGVPIAIVVLAILGYLSLRRRLIRIERAVAGGADRGDSAHD